MMSTLRTYFLLFRPASVIAMNLFLFVPILFQSHNVHFSLMQTLPFVVMLSGEIAFNDCCDYEKDRINKPQRPLVRGCVDIGHATIASAVMIALSVFLGIMVYHDSLLRMGCFLIVTVVLTLYNIKHPIMAMLKTVITAGMTVLTLSFVYTFSAFGRVQLFFLAAAFFFILGREMLMDIRDYEGDKINGYITIAVRFGVRYIAMLSCVSFLISAVFVFLMALSLSKVIVLLAMPILFFEFFCYYRCINAKSSKEQNKYILLLWVPIMFMLIIQLV